MSVDYKVRQIYNETIREVTKSPENWKEVLELMGRIYRYEFDNILMVYAQKPGSTLVADYDTWKKVDRYVLRGSKGIAIYPSRALSPHCRYVFDVSDTGGRKRQLTWNLEGETLEHYAGFLADTGELNIGNVSDLDHEAIKKVLWDFTKSRIDGIIKKSHARRGVVKEAVRSMIGKVYGTGWEADRTDLVTRSIYYVVANRCGFELTEDDKDFDAITAVREEDVIYELGSYISDVSCEVLRGISRDISRMEQERRMHYERSTDLQRGTGRDAVPEYQHGAGRSFEARQIRSDGDGLSEGEPLSEIPVIGEVRQADGGVSSGERGSTPDDRHDDGEVSAKPQAGESGGYDGALEDQTAGNDAGRGDRDTRDREPVPLNRSDDREPDQHNAVSEPNEIADTSQAVSDHEAVEDRGRAVGDDPLRDEQLNKELEDLDTFGERRDTGYEQMSLFSFHDSVLTEKEKKDMAEGRYTYLDPKAEDSVPHDYIVQVLKRGTGFVDGKKRVYNIMQNEPVKSERVRRIRKEYGIGGAGWPLEGYGLHGYDTFQGSGMRFQWRDEEGEKEGYVSWNSVESIISALMLTNDYYTPEPEIVTDGPEPETEKETDGVLTEEELDGYAIPDEMEDMGVPDYIRGDNDNTVTVDSDVMEEDAITITDIHEDSEIVMEGGSDRPEVTDADSIPPEPPFDMGQGNEADYEQSVMINGSKLASFHLNIWDTREGGAKTRFSWNVEAIKTLKQIEAEGRAVTKEEQQILAGYVGWGGLAQAFDDNNAAWSKEYAELKDLLTDSEYTAARASVNNAFYTPTMVAGAVTRALSQFGFKKGNILEPSMGVGNFFGCMPEELSDSRLYGVELDSISGRIAKLLYPDARIEIKGFEETDYPDNFFDVVIGNVPFGDYKIYDPKYNKLNFKVHDYFETIPSG